MFARRPPGIQINVPAIYSNALPPNITRSSSPGYLTPAVSGAHVWAEWLHHPCLLGVKKWGKGGPTGKLGGNFARCAQCANILFVNKGHHSDKVAMFALDSDVDCLPPTVFTVYHPFKCQGDQWSVSLGILGDHDIEKTSFENFDF